MPIPIEQVGIYAGSGGVIVAVAMKLLPFLFKKCNGNNKKYNGNNKPGKADECIKRGHKLTEHDTVIKQLCEMQEKHTEATETARKENREDHKQIFDKLDALK